MDTCPEHQQIVADMAVMKDNLADVKKISQEILTSIKGNGGPGLLTQAELNKSSIKRAWWWLGGVSLAILGLFGWALKKI